MVRVPAADQQFMSHALNVGAIGLVMPNVRTPAEARGRSRDAQPTPRQQGTAFGFAQDEYQGGAVGAKIEAMEARTLLIAQIKSVEGLANVEEIAAVDGIDGLWVGQYDLTDSMGIPGGSTTRASWTRWRASRAPPPAAASWPGSTSTRSNRGGSGSRGATG